MDAIRNVEFRIGSFIIHLCNGDELKIENEEITLRSGDKIKTAVVRYRGFIIWNAIEGEVGR